MFTMVANFGGRYSLSAGVFHVNAYQLFELYCRKLELEDM